MADNWKHRCDGMKCKTCMWFAAKQAGGMKHDLVGSQPQPDIDLGRCRKHAPTMNGYPVVFVNDWCGDHKLDENKFINRVK